MILFWGIVVLMLGGIGWVGQFISFLFPKRASQLGFMEKKSDLDPIIYIDYWAEACWDTFILWIFPFSGFLMILNSSTWPIFALVGGATYLYFAGRGTIQRILMLRSNISVGSKRYQKMAYLFYGIWGISGIISMVMAYYELFQN